MLPSDDHAERPRNLSVRAAMRQALAPVHRDRRPYEEPPMIERWVEATEQVLDPVVGLLDNLPAHLDPKLIPEDMLITVSRWLGLPVAVQLTPAARRRLIANAVPILRTRGTKVGLQLVLKLALPDAGLRVMHTGRVTWDTDPDSTAHAPEPAVEVHSPGPLDAVQTTTIHRLVRDQLPVNVPYRVVAAS